MTNITTLPVLWISLLEVKPLPGSEHEDMVGAFVQSIVSAISVEDALAKYSLALKELGFEMLGSEDTETFSDRLRWGTADEDTKNLASVAEQTGIVQFGDFNTWDEEEE